MKRNRNQNTCIRNCRDERQIERCKRKVDDLKPDVSSLAAILKIAGNDVRMNILILLKEENRLCVCDLSEILDMTIPAVSQHLKKLKDAELVDTEREGNTIYHYISDRYKSVLETLFAHVSEPMTG